MLVEHQAVEAHLLGVNLLVQVTVVKAGSQLGVVDFVAHRQVHDRFAGCAEEAGLGVLIRPFSEIANKHA